MKKEHNNDKNILYVSYSCIIKCSYVRLEILLRKNKYET